MRRFAEPFTYSPRPRANRGIRRTTSGRAGLLALIAGTVSCLHMHLRSCPRHCGILDRLTDRQGGHRSGLRERKRLLTGLKRN